MDLHGPHLLTCIHACMQVHVGVHVDAQALGLSRALLRHGVSGLWAAGGALRSRLWTAAPSARGTDQAHGSVKDAAAAEQQGPPAAAEEAA